MRVFRCFIPLCFFVHEIGKSHQVTYKPYGVFCSLKYRDIKMAAEKPTLAKDKVSATVLMITQALSWGKWGGRSETSWRGD